MPIVKEEKLPVVKEENDTDWSESDDEMNHCDLLSSDDEVYRSLGGNYMYLAAHGSIVYKCISVLFADYYIMCIFFNHDRWIQTPTWKMAVRGVLW